MDIAEDPGMAGTDVVPHGPSAANTRDVLFWDDHEPERWSSIVNPSIYRSKLKVQGFALCRSLR